MLEFQQLGGKMEKYLSILKYSTLFWGISENDLLSMIHCLDGRKVTYGKGEFLYHAGDIMQSRDAAA